MNPYQINLRNKSLGPQTLGVNRFTGHHLGLELKYRELRIRNVDEVSFSEVSYRFSVFCLKNV